MENNSETYKNDEKYKEKVILNDAENEKQKLSDIDIEKTNV